MKRLALTTIIFAFLTSHNAQATSIVELSLSQLTKQADEISQGKVKQQESFFAQDGRLIITRSVIEVLDSVKGGGSEQLVIDQMGGTVGDTKQVVHGVTLLKPQEEVFLFVEKKANAPAGKIAGFNQGHFKVYREQDQVRIRPVVAHGAHKFRVTTKGLTQIDDSGELREENLESFKSQIRELAAENQD